MKTYNDTSDDGFSKFYQKDSMRDAMTKTGRSDTQDYQSYGTEEEDGCGEYVESGTYLTTAKLNAKTAPTNNTSQSGDTQRVVIASRRVSKDSPNEKKSMERRQIPLVYQQ